MKIFQRKSRIVPQVTSETKRPSSGLSSRPQSRDESKKSIWRGALMGSLLLTSVLASSLGAVQGQSASGDGLTTSFTTMSFTDSFVWPSLLRTFESEPGGQVNQKLCNQIADCPEFADPDSNDSVGKYVNAALHIPLCQEDNDEYCIMGVSEHRGAVAENMSFIEHLDFDRVIGEVENLPRSMAPTVWRGELTGKSYLLIAQIVGGWSLGNSKPKFHTFSARLIPVDLLLSSRDSAFWYETEENGQVKVVGTGQTNGCAAVSNSTCYSPTSFEEDLALEVQLVLEESVGRWINGRFTSTDVSIEENGDGRIITSVAGYPVTVPRMTAALEGAEREDLLEILGIPVKDRPRYFNNYMPLEDSRESTLKAVSKFASSTNDRAEKLETIWQFSTQAPWELQRGSCEYRDSGGLQGVVSSNAIAYIAGPPQFDSGFLNYKVAGLHFAPDGETVNLGTYDLVIRSDVARCLYGFSKAPISATVSVVNVMGEEKVATTIVSEKDGWLKLAAYGFTFSEKEIQVQLRQSQIKTLSDFSGSTTTLSSAQKSQTRSVLSKSDGNTKFICTGIRYSNQPLTENIKVRARAKAACDYAKTMNPNFSYWYQTKTTKSISYAGKVLLVTKN
jgi:hypothetical protein